jgi:hypothetical protein
MRVQGWLAGNSATGKLNLYGDRESSNVVSIQDTGRVGIGTQTPQDKLDVRGAVRLGDDGNLSIASDLVGYRIAYTGTAQPKALVVDDSFVGLIVQGDIASEQYCDGDGSNCQSIKTLDADKVDTLHASDIISASASGPTIIVRTGSNPSCPSGWTSLYSGNVPLFTKAGTGNPDLNHAGCYDAEITVNWASYNDGMGCVSGPYQWPTNCVWTYPHPTWQVITGADCVVCSSG